MSDELRLAEDFTTAVRDVAIRANDSGVIDLAALRALVSRGNAVHLPGDTPVVLAGLHGSGPGILRDGERHAEHVYLRVTESQDVPGGFQARPGTGVRR